MGSRGAALRGRARLGHGLKGGGGPSWVFKDLFQSA